MSKFKKVIISLVLASVLSISSIIPLFANNVYAQVPNPWYDQNLVEFSDKVFDENNNEIFGERYTYAQVNWIMYSLVSMFIGGRLTDLIQIIQTLGYTDEAYNQIAQNTTIGASAALLDTIFESLVGNLPSGTSYVAEIINNFGIVTPVYAQAGFGFTALTWLLPLWRAIRNLTYVFFTLAFVAIGFMIMFRSKINPQTTITIQSAMPKMVFAIILITFSYAIAGFLVDLMYLVFYVFAYALEVFGATGSTIPNTQTAQEITFRFTTSNFGDVVKYVLLRGPGALTNVAGIGGTLIALVVAILGLVVILSANGAFAGIAMILLALIVAVVMYILSVIIMLAQSFLILVLNIVFAPVRIMYDIIWGGDNMGWIRSVTAELLVFLSMGFLFTIDLLLGGYIRETGPPWQPPYLGVSRAFLRGILSLGVLVLMPNLRNLIQQTFNRPPARIQEPGQFRDVGRQAQGAVEGAGGMIRKEGWGGAGQAIGSRLGIKGMRRAPTP